MLLQDDAHIFCTEAQIEAEVRGVLEFLAHAYGIFGFEFDLELSTRPEKYLGELATWDKAEAFMAKALDSFGKKWQVGATASRGPQLRGESRHRETEGHVRMVIDEGQVMT